LFRINACDGGKVLLRHGNGIGVMQMLTATGADADNRLRQAIESGGCLVSADRETVPDRNKLLARLLVARILRQEQAPSARLTTSQIRNEVTRILRVDAEAVKGILQAGNNLQILQVEFDNDGTPCMFYVRTDNVSSDSVLSQVRFQG
jgi:hypothetical protein